MQQNWATSPKRLTLEPFISADTPSLHLVLPPFSGPVTSIFLCTLSPFLLILAPLDSLPFSVQSQSAVLSPIVVFMPRGVLDIQDAPANSSQHMQIFIENILNLKQVPCYLGPVDTKEARKGTLLAILPAGKMVLTVTYLKRSQHENSCSPF